jgi:hypothetical protein
MKLARLIASAILASGYFGVMSPIAAAASVSPQSASPPQPAAVTTPTPLPSQEGPTVNVAAGDEISIVLLSSVGSRISDEGDTFAVETTSDYYYQGHLILPKGTPGYGVVTHVKRAGLFHAGGELSIAVRRLVAPDGRDFAVEVQGATGDANRDTEVNGSSFGQYLLWGFAGLFTKKGNDILLKRGAEFHVVALNNPAAEVIPYGTKPAPLDTAFSTSETSGVK